MSKPKNVAKRIEELAHPDADVRRRAARKLGEYGDCGAAESLCHALRDTDAYVRKAAAESLGILAPSFGPLHCDSSFEPLREAVLSKQDGLRKEAARAIGQITAHRPGLAPRAVLCILQAAQKSKFGSRHAYVDALTQMGEFAIAPLCVEFSSRRSEIMQECIRQTLLSLEQRSRLNVTGVVLADASLTAPQQWEALAMLAVSRPRSIFAPRYTTDARKFCELTAANPQTPEAVRRGAHAVLDYLSLGRASQRHDTTDASQLLRMAHDEPLTPDGGETLLRGADMDDDSYPEPSEPTPKFQILLEKVRSMLGGLRRRIGLS